MVTLICGIPNSGKSTYGINYDSVIHFDDIPHKNPSEQFATCNQLVSKSRESICVEGLYNNRRRRTEFIEAVKHKQEQKVCIWLDTPVEVCLEREHNYRHRPDSIVLHHAKIFEPPTYSEGWDEIWIVRNNEKHLLRNDDGRSS